MRRTLILGGVALVGLAGAAGWTVMDGGGHASGGTETGAISTGTAAVTRTDVAERQVLSGKLGYAGAYQVQATGAGVVTKLPPVGRRIRRGDAAYEIDGTKVPLMYGTRPVWRAFEVGMTDGADVRQLESNLKALGYGDMGLALPILAPVVTICPSTVTRGQTYHLFGRQFNGWSQAASFGDEFQTATNYPLIRIVNNSTGHVFYARTHDHSTMGVQTKNSPTFTNFDVPAGMETGASKLFVVANGIPSNPIAITVN